MCLLAKQQSKFLGFALFGLSKNLGFLPEKLSDILT